MRRVCSAFLLLLLVVGSPVGQVSASGIPRDVASPLFYSPWQHERNDVWQAATKAYYNGDLSTASELLESLLKQGGIDEVGVRLDLAAVYRELGALEKSGAQYRRLASLLPTNARILREFAWSLLALGQAEEALSIYDEAMLVKGADDPWIHLGRGLAWERLGRADAAMSAYREAVHHNDGFAIAWERLGLLYKRMGRLEEAAGAMEKALRTDAGYSQLVFPLAQTYDALGRPREAWTYYQRSARLYPGDKKVQDAFETFVASYREMLEKWEQDQVERRRRLTHKRLEPDPVRGGLLVKVGLVEGERVIELSAGSKFQANGRSLSAGRWTLSLSEGRIALAQEGGEQVVFAEDMVRLQLADPLTTWIALDLDAGRGYFWSRVEDLQVRGDLIAIARPAGLTLVNELDIEEYLLAVVPSEMYPSMPMEALKAQAIAARTYTLRHLGRYQSRGFDVMGSVLSSAYRGVDRETVRTTQAVQSTAGQVLTYNGALAESYYHSTAGGYTASSAEVWGGRGLPYLVAAPEWSNDRDAAASAPPFPLTPAALYHWYRETPAVFSQGTGFGSASSFRWILPVRAEVIMDRVVGGNEIGRLVAIVPGARGVGGWVSSVTVVGTKGTRQVRGDTVRSRLGGLKSSAFTILPLNGPDGLPEEFLFVGGGFGHGVGLSQTGAAGMAQRGMGVEQIFQQYYPGTVITERYGKIR